MVLCMKIPRYMESDRRWLLSWKVPHKYVNIICTISTLVYCGGSFGSVMYCYLWTPDSKSPLCQMLIIIGQYIHMFEQECNAL